MGATLALPLHLRDYAEAIQPSWTVLYDGVIHPFVTVSIHEKLLRKGFLEAGVVSLVSVVGECSFVDSVLLRLASVRQNLGLISSLGVVASRLHLMVLRLYRFRGLMPMSISNV